MTLIETIIKNGIGNCVFVVPMRPLRGLMGVFLYTSTSDPEKTVMAKIVNTEKEILQTNKLKLESLEKGFGVKKYYISDLSELIKVGDVLFYTFVDPKTLAL